MANKILIKKGTRGQLNTARDNSQLNQGEPYLITGEGRIAVGLGDNTYESFVKESELKNGTLSLQMGTEAATATTVTIGTGTGFSANTDTNTTYTVRVGPALRDLADTMTGAGTGFLKKDGADNFILDTNTYLTSGDIVAPGDGTLAVSVSVTPASSGTVLSWGTSSGFSANTGTNATYDLRVGPALKELADTMTGAGTGFLKKDGADNLTLDTNSYITGNQSITLSGDIEGTGATGITATLKTVNSNVGEFTKVTVNAKGLVTAATGLVENDIPSLTASKISDFNTSVQGSRLDQMAAPTGPVSLNNQKITGLATPNDPSDAANRGYVDSVAQGLDIKPSVRLATTGNITLSGAQSVDGLAVATDDRILVKNQSTASQNGIYIANTSAAWTRAPDANDWNELISAFTFVEEGNTNADTSWVCTINAGSTIGSAPITFTQFGAAASIIDGAGLLFDGNTLNVGAGTGITVNANNVQISASYAGQNTITTVGTIGAGTWQGTAVGVAYGGIGLTSAITGLLKGNGTIYSAATAGTDYLDPNSTIDGGTF